MTDRVHEFHEQHRQRAEAEQAAKERRFWTCFVLVCVLMFAAILPLIVEFVTLMITGG